VYLSQRKAINVLMVSKGNLFLQNALDLDSRTQLTRSDGIPANLATRKFDLVIFDGVDAPKSLPPGGYLIINASAAQGPASVGSPVSRPTIVDAAKNHPASAFVDFTSVKIAEARYLSPKPWGTVIVEGDGGPLAVAGAKNGRTFVQLSFSLLESDFPLHVGFPIFVANCLDWLVPAANGGGESIRTGQTAHIDIPPGVSEVIVTDPDKREQRVKITQTPMVFDDTERAGVYHVRAKGFDKEFACNLSSSDESDIRPKSEFTVGGKQFASSGKMVQTNREFYGLAILAVLAVLMFEWYAYHRRM